MSDSAASGLFAASGDAAVVVFDQLLVLLGDLLGGAFDDGVAGGGLTLPHSLVGLVDLLGEVGVGLPAWVTVEFCAGVLRVVLLRLAVGLSAGRVAGRAVVAALLLAGLGLALGLAAGPV